MNMRTLWWIFYGAMALVTVTLSDGIERRCAETPFNAVTQVGIGVTWPLMLPAIAYVMSTDAEQRYSVCRRKRW